MNAKERKREIEKERMKERMKERKKERKNEKVYVKQDITRLRREFNQLVNSD